MVTPDEDVTLFAGVLRCCTRNHALGCRDGGLRESYFRGRAWTVSEGRQADRDAEAIAHGDARPREAADELGARDHRGHSLFPEAQRREERADSYARSHPGLRDYPPIRDVLVPWALG